MVVVNPILSAQAADLRRRQLRLEADRARGPLARAPRGVRVSGTIAALLRTLADRIAPGPARRAEPPIRLVRS